MARNEHKDTPVWTIDGKVFLNREFKIYDADVDENVTSKYNVALS